MSEIDPSLVPKLDKTVRYIASSIHRKVPPSVLYEDLVSQGWLGVMVANRAYDPAIGVLFTSFAQKHIEGSIKSYLRDFVDPLSRDHRKKVKSGKLASVQILEIDKPTLREEPMQIIEPTKPNLDSVLVLDSLLRRVKLTDRNYAIFIDCIQHDMSRAALAAKYAVSEPRVAQILAFVQSKLISAVQDKTPRCRWCFTPLPKYYKDKRRVKRLSRTRLYCSKRCVGFGRWVNSSRRKLPGKVVLFDLYVNKKWSIKKIANYYRCAVNAVREALIKYAIDRRPRGPNHPPNTKCKVCGSKVTQKSICKKIACCTVWAKRVASKSQ